MQTLIFVAGHAIPRQFDRLDRDDGWYLKFFQSGEGPCYLDHVREAVLLAATEPDSLLIFAGGQTDLLAGPRSEGQGYWLIADHFGWFGHPAVRNRATTEEYSLDSFQNLLYSICRFREFTGQYPQQVIALGWRFKAERFEVHREAIRWPADRYRYVGVNDPPELSRHIGFESERRELFRQDPYGNGKDPATKRAARNVQRRYPSYPATCPELSEFLSYQGSELYLRPLPWAAE